MKIVTSVLFSFIFSLSLFADWSIDQKIFATDGEGEDYFGESVSISENYAIVGAPLNNFPLGAAYLYQKVNDNWLLVEKITPSDSLNTMGFGSSVFMNNDYMIIGANHNYNNSSGSAYIYHKEGENWNEINVIEASGSPICDQYGCTVAITEDGIYAVVGAFNDDENGEGSGAAYIYIRSGIVWNLQTKLMAFDGAIDDLFGYSVSITDNYLFISALNDDDNGEQGGSVYVYQNTGSNWEFHSKLIASNYTMHDRFGWSTSVNSDYIVIGAPGLNENGEAYIFRLNNSNWVEDTILTASDCFNYDHFGRSVSISNDYIIIGACDVPDVACSASAYFFEKEGLNWIERNKLTIDGWGAFGYSVSISGENAIVGANLDSGVSNATGAAYLISNDETSINQHLVNYSINDIHNYPNPFNPTTTIEFSILNDSKVNLTIFNIKGQKIITLANNEFTKGIHSLIWNGDNESEYPVGSGVYYYQLNVNGITKEVKKCLLLK